MNKKNLIITFIIFLLNINYLIFSYNKLNQSLFKLKKVLYNTETPIVLYDVEFITNELIVYSNNSGLFLLNINSGEKKTLINISKIYKDKTWGQMGDFYKINDNEFYFLNGGNPFSEYRGLNKYDLVSNSITHIDKIKNFKLKNQPEGFDKKKLKLKAKYPCLEFDTKGKYVFVVDMPERGNPHSFGGGNYGDFFRYTIDGKEKELLAKSIKCGHKKFFIANNFILTAAPNAPILLDYNGNILQWYSNLVWMYGAISPDGKKVIFSGAVYDKDTRFIYNEKTKKVEFNKGKAELTMKHNGLLLYEIDNEILKELLNYSKSFENINDKERLKRNSVILDFNVIDRYRSKEEKIEKIGEGIYKVRM